MLDFLMISTRSGKRGVIEIYPKFIIKKSNDLMIRGGDFYAIWIDERGIWSTDEQDAVDLIDRELDQYAEENRKRFDGTVRVLHMWDAETGMIDTWHKYCQKQMKDQFHMLDEKLIFSNTKAGKRDYASKSLPYPLEPGDTPAWDKLVSTLYSPEERHKIEWSIGAIVSGESKRIQKFLVFYGAVGTGKSTIINVIQQLFEGYYTSFNAKDLGSSSNAFALEAFRSNPLVAIQHDGDLSRIEDNTRINSLVSHEMMTVNEKFRSAYSNRFKAFLIMGTNKPVKITDAKSGIIRRLIDVTPTGDKVPPAEYRTLTKQIPFELGGIAYHCQEVYLEDPDYYDDYIPISMMGASNDFYNFVVDSYHVFKKEDGVSLKSAWEMYKTYCDDAKVPYPVSRMIFKEELKNYFRSYEERFSLGDGSRVRNYYSGFRTEKFEEQAPEEKPAAKRQEPVLRNFMPEVAPEHNEADRLINKKAEQRAAREEAAKRAQAAQEPSLIRRLINFLFGSDQKPAEEKKDEEKKGRSDRRSRRNPRDRREKDSTSRRQRRERTRVEKDEDKSASVDKPETTERVKTQDKEAVRDTQTRRRPRRRVKSEDAPELLPAPETKVALPKPVVEEAAPAPQTVANDEDFNFATDTIPEAKVSEERVEVSVEAQPQAETPNIERRPRRRRRTTDDLMVRRDRIPPEIEAEEMNRAPIVLPEEYIEEAPVRTEPLNESELHSEVKENTIEPRHVNVESQIANQKREPLAQRPRAEEQPLEEKVEDVQKTEVTVEVPVAEATLAVEETVSETTEVTAEDAMARLTAGLDEALAKSGLTVVHTNPKLVHPVDYSPVIYPGRPRKVLPPLDDTPLIQVHTKTL